MSITESNGTFTFTATDTTYSTVSKSSSGLCPQLPNETTTTKYLRQDGTWATPTDNDTKNTAGSYENSSKLFLIGTTSQTNQTGSAQTYSNSNVYMTNGTLTAPALSTSTMVLPEGSLYLEFVNGNNKASAANFSYQTLGGARLDITGHLVLNEGGTHPSKPENKTGLNYEV